MKITKTTSKTYDVEFYPNVWKMTWEKFKRIRERYNRSTSEFSACFVCGHDFADEEIPIMITVSTKGNLFGCDSCYEKHLEGLHK